MTTLASAPPIAVVLTVPSTPETEALKDHCATSPVLLRFQEELEHYGETLVVHIVPPNGDGRHGASWTTRGSEHLILVPSDSGGRGPSDPDESPMADMPKRLRRLEASLRHEAAHGLYTDRDHHLQGYTAHHYHISPQQFNLFEDARIEDAARWDDPTPFGYLSGPKPLFEHATVQDMTHPLIMSRYLSLCECDAEHEAVAMTKWAGDPETMFRGKRYRTVELIKWFVRRAQAAQTTRHLWTPMLEFIEAFGGEYVPPEEYEAAGIPAPNGRLPGDALPDDGYGT